MEGISLLKEGEAILEIKIQEAMPLWLVDILEKGEIRKGTYSKVGEAYNAYISGGNCLVYLSRTTKHEQKFSHSVNSELEGSVNLYSHYNVHTYTYQKVSIKSVYDRLKEVEYLDADEAGIMYYALLGEIKTVNIGLNNLIREIKTTAFYYGDDKELKSYIEKEIDNFQSGGSQLLNLPSRIKYNAVKNLGEEKKIIKEFDHTGRFQY